MVLSEPPVPQITGHHPFKYCTVLPQDQVREWQNKSFLVLPQDQVREWQNKSFLVLPQDQVREWQNKSFLVLPQDQVRESGLDFFCAGLVRA
ncbi:uncharacterized protein LOC127007691 isoform X12 [Eriocheir sinensis]|uniref:uncharacterized protein LOC127007691 isoform X10 n=1 Tax=Eriocheir sinensis TaxID=95602 RepID=UPI0021C89B3A|nr:uncharacterized protein LOC127007691 isoform X10 [Eriocheir sinensis]XP_050734877.1 uncharacterized protein LOC127007691 isoform X11 [Eriocheir sinensis]XP_050734878.1 uncharacterized protein LOC127007691 isoform X12 [Eriocheir sinensis]